ncbi:NB-ARC [Dillenia turbinata]|uniref:NB-ARC n=1 Tax=Dillenia turbinata TaxID=194707 RepID=A0AAN8UU04_9MAGN
MVEAAVIGAVASAAAVEAYKDGRMTFSYIKEQLNIAKKMDSSYRNLESEVKKLRARRDDIQAEIDKDLRLVATKECEVWIGKVKEVEKAFSELEARYQKEKRKAGWKLRLRSRLKITDKLEVLCQDIQNLLGEGKFEKVVVERIPECVRIIHAPNLKGTPTLQTIVGDILDFLRDEGINRIGLWGMVGTGKSTIMQNLNDNEDIGKMFDIVILVTVSKEWSVEKIQQTIIQRLKLNVEGITCMNEIAWRISEELKKKKYLLLLDEVCDTVDLHLVGVRNCEKNSKVVLATRYRHVCYLMNTDEEIQVERLPDADAWNLFQEKVGRYINLPGVKPVAQLVAKECAGVPLLLDRVARTFRKKDNIHLWRGGLKKLKRWPSVRIPEIDEMLELLRFCYEELDGNDKKKCFLYGALYPEECDIYIDHLLECWRAEDFIDTSANLREAHDSGHTILDDLISVSLLEKGQKMGYIKMNKVIRSVALKISRQSKDTKVFVKTCEGLSEPPNEEQWREATRVSLMDNRLSCLPENPPCSKLLTLFLQRNPDLGRIHELFFQSMKMLRVLDLGDTRIASLPSSLSCLTSLRALYLKGCVNLMEFPSDIKELKNLEILDIRCTGFHNFPIQIGGLICLKCLRLSLSSFDKRSNVPKQIRNVKAICDVISRLFSLEELTIEVESCMWWSEAGKAVAEKVATLTNLTNLNFCFPTANCLAAFLGGGSSWNRDEFVFQFFVGDHQSTQLHIHKYFEYPVHQYLRYANGDGVDHYIIEVLGKTYAFELIGLKGVSKISDFGINSMKNIRCCIIKNCNELTTLVDGTITNDSMLPCVEKIFLCNLPYLVSIWEGPTHMGSLSQLATLTFHSCQKLKKIFSRSMIQQLNHLQYLIVENCSEIEEIIMEAENDMLESCALPKLKALTLVDLPLLKSIWVDGSLEWPSLDRLKVHKCGKLLMLPFTKDNANKLRSIEGEEAWWRALIWKDNAVQERLHPICAFV